MTKTSGSLMNTTKKGPSEAKSKRKGRSVKKGEEQPTDFWDTEGNHYGQASPRRSLKVLMLPKRGWEGFHLFFSGVGSAGGRSC
jgi:hypothetical protein